MSQGTGAESSRLRWLLHRLEERWVAEGAGIAAALRPPVTEEQLRQAEAEIGARLPEEVRVWFGWHDGVDESAGVQTSLPFLRELVSLDLALDLRWEFLSDAPRPEYTYRSAWLPFASAGPSNAFVVDCSGGTAALTPIHIVDFWTDEPWDIIRTPSLTAVVEMWWQLTEQGIYRWNPQAGGWENNDRQIPEEFDQTGLV